jgi:predicted pyridoxine 5'-phosphate oxidase superfamily flavin-nucleotide-binding protein
MIDDDVRRSIDASVLCWLATCDADGWPNVSPKEIFCAEDDRTLLIAQIASPQSVRNIRTHPQVCVSFIDVFAQKGHKLHGRAAILDRHDPAFEHVARPLLALAGDAFPVSAAIRVTVERVATIVAPSYRLIPGTTEAGQIESAMATYGVMARPD